MKITKYKFANLQKNIKKNAFYIVCIIIIILVLGLGLGLGLKKSSPSSSGGGGGSGGGHTPQTHTLTLDEAKSKALKYASEQDNQTKVNNSDKPLPITCVRVYEAKENPGEPGQYIVALLGLVYDIQQSDNAIFIVDKNGISVYQDWGQSLWPVNNKVCACPLTGTYKNDTNTNLGVTLAGFSIGSHSYSDITLVNGNTDGFDKDFKPIVNLYSTLGSDGTLSGGDYMPFNEHPIQNNPFVSVNINGSGIEQLTTNGIPLKGGLYLYLGWMSAYPDKVYFVYAKSPDGKATSITNDSSNINFFYYSSNSSPNTNGGALDIEYK